MIRTAAIAFALFVVPSSATAAAMDASDAATRPATVNVVVDARIEGRRAWCVGKLLFPRSSATDDRMHRIFGNTDRGYQVLSEPDLLRARYGDGPFASQFAKDRCRYFTDDFKRVTPGEYYATALVSASGGSAHEYGESPEKVGALLMRRVTVAPGREVRIKLED